MQKELGGIIFARESIASFFDDALPLFEKHFKEVSHFQDIPLNIDLDTYQLIDANGALRIFTARQDGELVGYAVFFVKLNPRYSTSLQANQDILFINPSCRAKGFGQNLIAFCDEQLKAEGVQVVYQHVKATPKLNFGPLLERMNYELVDLIFAKRLN